MKKTIVFDEIRIDFRRKGKRVGREYLQGSKRKAPIKKLGVLADDFFDTIDSIREVK